MSEKEIETNRENLSFKSESVPNEEANVVDSTLSILDLWESQLLLKKLSLFTILIQTFKKAIYKIKNSLLMSFFSFISVLLAVFVLVVFVLFSNNLTKIISDFNNTNYISVFLEDTLPLGEQGQIAKLIQNRPEVFNLNFISKEEALTQFRKNLGGQAGLLTGLEEQNPLPASIEIYLKSTVQSDKDYDQFISFIGGLKGVEEVKYDRALFKDLNTFIFYIKFIYLICLSVLLVITTVIVSNSISLLVNRYIGEMKIQKLIGASFSFIKSPYYVVGFLISFSASIVAILLSYLVFQYFNSSMPKFILFNELSKIEFLSPIYLILILFFGVFVGLVGSSLGLKDFDR